MCLQPLKKQVVTFQGLFHQNFIPQLLLNKGFERQVTIFQHDSILSICPRGNTDLDVASICNGVVRKESTIPVAWNELPFALWDENAQG